MIPSATRAAKQVFAPLLVPFILLITTLTPFVSSHAVMVMPIPYQAPVQDSGPIHTNTFPCHAGPVGLQLPTTGPNSFPLGSKQSLKFQGSAVHSGGSCQVSITYDNPPTRDSKFRVIKSIEGGCVTRNVKGNRSGGEGATMPNPDEYEYTIPDDIPTGNGTIAWTWFNRSGQREMYMACAPLSITGTDKPNAKQTFEGLPEIFKANTFGNGCTFPEDKDVLFPNPGRDVVKSNGATTAWASPTGAGCEKPTEGGGAGAGAAAAATTTSVGVGAGASASASAVTMSKSTAGAGGAVTTAPYPVANSTASAAGAGSSLPGAAFVTIAPAVGGNTASTAPGAWITVPSTGAVVNHTLATAMSSAVAAAVAPVSFAAAAASAPPAGSSVPACSAPTNVVTSSAAVATTSAIPKSSAPPSTLLTSTVAAPSPLATASSMPRPAMASTSGQGQTMPETLPPSGACPVEQDGWYVCHLKPGSLYGAYYHRCASGLWTGMMAVPPGLACKMAETAADSHDAAARSKPEKTLTLELGDDDPLEIIPVTVARRAPRAPTAPAAGLVDDYGKRSVVVATGTGTGTVAGPEVTSTSGSTGGTATDDQQDQDQDYLPDYEYYEEESSSSSSSITEERSLTDGLDKIASTKLNLPRSNSGSAASPDSHPDLGLEPGLQFPEKGSITT